MPEDAALELGTAANLDAIAVERLLARWVSEAVLERVPGVRPLRLTKHSVKSTPVGYRVLRPHRQPALRAAQANGHLELLAKDGERVLGVRSRAGSIVALQQGDLARAGRKNGAGTKAPQPDAASDEFEELLRESICEPFDEKWFEGTWGDQARSVALRVLRYALRELDECGDLYVWACRQDWSFDEDARRGDQALEAAHVLAEHALLREQLPLAERLVEGLPLAERLGYLAAARYIEDDFESANRLLDQALAFRSNGNGRSFTGPGKGSGRTPACGAATPILALLAERRRTADSSALARRLLAAGGPATRGATKALRTLQRYTDDPEARHRRIDAYQLPAGTNAWGRLLLGVTVHAHLEQDWTRAAWAKSLVEVGIAWNAAGYSWMGRQALLLAERLDEEQFELAFEPERRRRRWGKLRSNGSRGELRELVRPPEAWERALTALERVSEQVSAEQISDGPEHRARIEWAVSALDGGLGHPALSLFEDGVGWSPSRRVSLEELVTHRAELSSEDQRVLRCVAPAASGTLEFTEEAFEALVGHPRVHDAHGRAMSVESATPHLKTVDDGGGLRVQIVPGPVQAGVHVAVEGTRLVVYRVTLAMQRVFEVLPRDLRIPREAEAQALEALAKVADVVEVRGTAIGATERVEANETPCVRITPVAGAFLVEIGIRPFGDRGRFFPAGAGPAMVSIATLGQRRRTERDFDSERARVTRLIAECPTLMEVAAEERAPGEAAESWILGHERVLGLLSELRSASEPHDFEWPEGSPFRVVGNVSTRSLHGNLRRTKGWYLATGGVRIDELTSLKLSELASLPAVARGRFLRLPSGDYVEVERRVQRVMAVLRAGEPLRRDAGVRLHGSAIGALRELLDDESGFEVDDAVRKWLREFEQIKQRSFEVPSELRAELRPYQVEGYRWLSALSELGLGACLADDMGLGKTLQILALLLRRTERGPVLVVAPTSVCTNWVREAEKFAPGLEVHEYVGANRAQLLARIRKCGEPAPASFADVHDADPQNADARGASASDSDPASRHPILVCSYQVLQQDIASLAEIVWSTVVLDEAQFIKNPASQRARAAFALEAEHRIAATGTPVENHLGDLWSIFHFLNPALLGGLRAFQSRFSKPIERDEDSGQEAILRAMVAPYILRREKSEVLRDLPPLTTIAHEVRLSDDEALRYASLRREIHEKLRSSAVKRHHKLEVLAEITRLRRFCCHPSLVFPGAGPNGSKVEAFLELATEIAAAGHRALVFSQFVDFLDLVRERLHEQGLDYEYLDGSTPKGERQKRVDAFQAGSAPLFLISLKAGGFGLNLTNADYVIHLDPWWNPAVESQATDRAHRIGQTRPVTVYRLVTKDSIEERIVELHETKRRLAQALFEGGERAAKLSTEDLLTLIEDGPFVS